MEPMFVSLQPACIMQHKQYRESSLLLTLFTRDYGLVSVVAKGVRKKKRPQTALLMPFALLQVSFTGKAELKTLTNVEIIDHFSLAGIAPYCGFYLNELIEHFLYRFDPHPEVFELYLQCLRELTETKSIEQILRVFELKLTQYAGYGLNFTHQGAANSIETADKIYQYLPGYGLQESRDGYVSGKTLMMLESGQALDAAGLGEAKMLMRQVLDDHLQGKEIKSRAVLHSVLKYLA